MMRKSPFVAVAAAAVIGCASPLFADVQLSMQNGRVTIVATDATVRQILMEWARVGETKIVNVERIPGAPISLELRDVPEPQALKILLRSLSGYMTAPRATAGAAKASVFDRIIVMPTLATASAPLSAGPPPPTVAPFAQPFPPPLPDDDDQRVPNPSAPVAQTPAGNRGPVFVFPQPQVTTPQQLPPGQANPGQAAPVVFTPQQPVSAPAPSPAVPYPGAPTTPAPAGAAFPGMIVPGATPQGGQPVQPAQPK